MKGLFIPGITAEMFRSGCLESIDALMAEGELYDINYSPWIPVSDRLPEEDGVYIVTYDGEICGEDAPFSGLAEFENGKWVDDEEDYQCVLGWMPLPKPYKAESKLDGDPIDIDKAVEHYEGTLEMLKGIDLEDEL